jgi:hypothetical protein
VKKKIKISLCLPVSCEVEVVSNSDGEDLTIVGVRRLHCELSARSVTEHMKEEDFEELERVFAKANEEEG